MNYAFIECEQFCVRKVKDAEGQVSVISQMLKLLKYQQQISFC